MPLSSKRYGHYATSMALSGLVAARQLAQCPRRGIGSPAFFELKIKSSEVIAKRHGWPEPWVERQQAVKQHNTSLDPAAFNALLSSLAAATFVG